MTSAKASGLWSRKGSSFHLLKSKAQRRWNRMRTTIKIIAPHHDRPACSKDALMIVHIAYLVFHCEAGSPHSCYTYSYLDTIRTYQGKLISASNLFDQQPIMTLIWARLNARIMRRM